MDVVYPLKEQATYEELRYSLRSLMNLPHHDVWLVGGLPRWIRHVRHIKRDHEPILTKYKASGGNIQAACLHDGVSEDFILMNDDFFIMRPMKEVKTYHRGELAEMIANYPVKGQYYQGMVRTLELLQSLGIKNPLSYELHTPIVINKKMKLDLTEKFNHPLGYHLRTLYCNYYGIEGEYRKDVKLYRADEFPRDSDLLSTSDNYARGFLFKHYLQAKFPKMSYYETKPIP